MCPYVIWPEKEFISSEDNYQILIGLSAMQNNITFGYSPLHLLLVCCARILFSRTYVDNRNVPSTHTTSFWRRYTTSITLKRRRMDVKTTLCAYWVTLEQGTELLLGEYRCPLGRLSQSLGRRYQRIFTNLIISVRNVWLRVLIID